MKATTDIVVRAVRYIDALPLSRARLAWAAALSVVAVFAPAAVAAQGVPLDYAAHERMKADLASRVVMVEVQPAAVAFEEPSMVPLRFGQGAAVLLDGKPVVATSWFLVAGAASITVAAADGSARAATVVLSEFPDRGLTILALPPETAAAMKHPPESPGVIGAPDPARLFFCVSPVTPGTFVLTETAVSDRAGPPLDGAFMAPGILGPGTVLFDADGRPFGIAARESYSGNGFTIVAPLGQPPAETATETEDADVQEP